MSAQELLPTPSDFDAQGALTRAFLLRRETCCENGCRNCPYGFDAASAAVSAGKASNFSSVHESLREETR